MFQLIPPHKNWLGPIIKNLPMDYFFFLGSLKIIKYMLQLKFNAVTN